MSNVFQKVHFEIVDKHPGRGKKRGVIKSWTEDIVLGENDIPGAYVKSAGKRYLELNHEYNGMTYTGGRGRYEVKFYWV